jgi:hypothetical protein
MYKIVLIVLVALLSTSCSLSKSKPIDPNAKVFPQEDAFILFALRAEQLKDYKAASKLFTELYKNSKKKEYLYRSFENELLLTVDDTLVSRIDKEIKENKDDAQLIRLKIVALIEINRLDEARDLSVALASETKEENDYILASDVYIKRQEFDLAVRYLESAYALDHSEKILDKMSIILYVNLSRKKEAIALLETHSRMIGCSKLICLRLIAIYSNENNIDGLLSTSLRLYSVDKSQELAEKIVQYYSYKQDYLHLMDFLEESHSNDDILLQLYSSSSNYKKATLLADKLYEESGDVKYLGQSAIFEYKSAKNRDNKKLLESVVSKLERVIKLDSQPIYLNYLGYLLIDHSLDIKKGMGYIDEVLKLQPNSGYYLDSKAWGYYKLGNCKKAKEIMNHVMNLEGGNDLEVKEHITEINNCILKEKTKKVKIKK